MEILEKVDQLKAELDRLRPLDAEAEARIMQKFRLDWNYHSNNIEGNSLTYGETKALILFGITAQGKPLRDHFEITGHNDAVNWVLDLVKGHTELTEVFIRELHTLILKESSYKEAKTPNGKPTRRKIEVGKYKTQPNHVITSTGETFYFATPEETPAKMQELVEWFRKEKVKPDVNPIILAALFHYRFIRIHPFDDGNGRVARILMNFILMQFGYPPAIIKTEDKENYYAVLRLADADELDPFIEYITQNLVRSLEIMLKGAKGEDIEEMEDLDKELALLERRLSNIGNHVQELKTQESILDVFDNSIVPLVNSLASTAKKFDRLYKKSSFFVKARGGDTNYASGTLSINELRDKINGSINFVQVFFGYSNLIQVDTIETFAYDFVVKIEFDIQFYVVKGAFGGAFRKNYSEYLSESEIKSITSSISKKHKEAIEGVLDNIQGKLA